MTISNQTPAAGYARACRKMLADGRLEFRTIRVEVPIGNPLALLDPGSYLPNQPHDLIAGRILETNRATVRLTVVREPCRASFGEDPCPVCGAPP